MCKSTFSIEDFMKSKSRSSISDENLTSKFDISVNYMPDFEDFMKTNEKYLINVSYWLSMKW